MTKMLLQRVSSVGVLNKERELLGVLSATDIVAVAPQANLLQLLNSNVINFLQKMKVKQTVLFPVPTLASRDLRTSSRARKATLWWES